MSIEYPNPMNYVYLFKKSVAQTDGANIVPTSTLKRVVSDIVICLYTATPVFYTVFKHPESINVPIIPSGNGALSNPTVNLAAGISGIVPIYIKIPGPIELPSNDYIAIRFRVQETTLIYMTSTCKVTFN